MPENPGLRRPASLIKARYLMALSCSKHLPLMVSGFHIWLELSRNG